jgi:hypothetical protein
VKFAGWAYLKTCAGSRHFLQPYKKNHVPTEEVSYGETE